MGEGPSRPKDDQLLDTFHCLHTFGLALEVGRGEREPKGTGSQLSTPRLQFGGCQPSSHMQHVVVPWLHLTGRKACGPNRNQVSFSLSPLSPSLAGRRPALNTDPRAQGKAVFQALRLLGTWKKGKYLGTSYSKARVRFLVLVAGTGHAKTSG